MPVKYKSILLRENQSVVFKLDNKIIEKFDNFIYLPSAMNACNLLHKHFKAQEVEDYIKQTLGENATTLDLFKNKENQEEDSREIRKKYKLRAYRGFISKFGISPLNFKRVFNAIMLEIWAVKPYFSRYCYNKYRINEDLLKKVHKNLSLMNSARDKGLDNIVPFILYSGLSASSLKKLFGASLWKKLISNSHHKNHLIAKRVSYSLDLCSNSKAKVIGKRKELLTSLEYFNKLPSTILEVPHFFGLSDPEKDTIFSLLNCLKVKEVAEELNDGHWRVGGLYTTIFETIKRSKELNKKYSINWTKEDWIKKYEEYKVLEFYSTSFNK